MSKTRFLVLITGTILISFVYWGFAGFEFYKKAVIEKRFYNYISDLSNKYYGLKYAGVKAETDSVSVGYQNLYDVLNYKLNLGFDTDNKSVSGIVNINSQCLSDTLDKIFINLSGNMNVSYVRLDGIEINFERTQDYIIIDSKNKLSTGQLFDLEISYDGKPENKGFDSFGFKKFDDETAFYTLSEPNYAPTWWPCKDVISDKSIVEMNLTVPAQMTAVSNGLLKEIKDAPGGRKTFYWKSSYPISTYLVSVAAGKYDHWTETYTSIDGAVNMPVEYYTYPEYTEKAKIDWSNTTGMLKYFSELFGEYPFINEKYGMALFGWVGGAMEHQTITSMGYTLIRGNRKYEKIVVHELVHQWFGDAVTPLSWKDIWLNEGFATYGEALWEEHINGKEAYKEFLDKEDYGFFNTTVYNPEGFLFGPVVYNKGCWCLHMLRGVVGDSVFFKILRTYYDKFKYGNAGTYDFKQVCEEVFETDLTYFFNQWIFDAGERPVYRYSWRAVENYDSSGDGNYNVTLKLRQIQNDYEVYQMPVSVSVKTENGLQELKLNNNSREQIFEFPVQGKPVEIIVDKDNYILKQIEKEEYKD